MPKSKHCVHFYGPVSPRSFENLRSAILEALQVGNAKNLCLYLSSEGGDLNSGFTAYNFIRALPVPVTAINIGTVESIAVLMFLACDERLIVPEGRFLLHSFNWNFGNIAVKDHARISEHTLSLDYDVERYAKIFDDRTQGAQTSVDIRECLNGKALILGAAAASDAGIVTDIVPAERAISCDDTHWWPSIC